MMGGEGLKRASQLAILNANYISRRLEEHYPVLYTGSNGLVAHECILDLRPIKDSSGISVDDVAKRLIDFGFHAPTMSFPVAGTLMIEPTESESREELDRFCDAMIKIREEIRAVENGTLDKDDNPLKNAPHTAAEIVGQWSHPYSREQAVYPVDSLIENKYWPPVGRVDNVFGDRNWSAPARPSRTIRKRDSHRLALPDRAARTGNAIGTARSNKESNMSTESLLTTPLHALHRELGAKMVPFAGYDMPVQYPAGVMKEHLHTRAQAGLFDVSHMGQIRLTGADAAKALEALVPVDIIDLPVGMQRYAMFTDENGGILDDLMVANLGNDQLMLVVNAACKDQDLAHLCKHLAGHCKIEPLFEERALLALQGPAAVTVLARLAPKSPK